MNEIFNNGIFNPSNGIDKEVDFLVFSNDSLPDDGMDYIKDSPFAMGDFI